MRYHGAAVKVVVFHVHEELAFGADPLSLMPVCASFDRLEVPFADYLGKFVGVGHWAVAHLVVAATAAAASALLRVVVVVHHLVVRVAVVIVAGCPVEGCVVVGPGLSYSGQWG